VVTYCSTFLLLISHAVSPRYFTFFRCNKKQVWEETRPFSRNKLLQRRVWFCCQNCTTTDIIPYPPRLPPILYDCNEVLFVLCHSAATDQRSSKKTMNDVPSGSMTIFGAAFGAMYDVYGASGKYRGILENFEETLSTFS
jgi:hypothetical protein